MNNLRNSAFYLIIVGWLVLLSIVCGLLIAPLPRQAQDAVPLVPYLAANSLLFLGLRIYRGLSQKHKVFIRFGALLTATGALIGNLIFLSIDDIRMIALSGFDFLQSSPQFVLLEILVTSCITALPSLFCGAALAFALLQDQDHDIFSVKSSLLKGLVLGVTLGISLCIGVAILVGPHASFDIWLNRSIIVVLIAGSVGLGTGWKLGNSIPGTQPA